MLSRNGGPDTVLVRNTARHFSSKHATAVREAQRPRTAEDEQAQAGGVKSIALVRYRNPPRYRFAR